MTANDSQIRHGDKVGRFVVVGELGSGGMGVVYAAHDRELDRHVALKVMRVASVEETDRVRMLREGQAMARVTHPNVITVYEVGTDGGIVFLAQELLDGGTLGQWLDTPHSQQEIIQKFVAAGRGLAAAHAAGLVHRDFKPDNVLLGKDGRVRVADFGLARAADRTMLETQAGGGRPLVEHGALERNLTHTGTVMGTPMFMAPEQHEGRGADARSDQFAFCVALYHALHGDWPFAGKTAISLADNVINGVMQKPPVGSKVPAPLRAAVLRGLATDPEARFPSMEALLAQLTVRKKSKAPLVVGGALALVAGAAGSIFLLSQGEKPSVAPLPAPVVVQDDERDFDPVALTNALGSGQLDAAIRSFNDDAMLLRDAAKVSRARSAAALVLALRGELDAADAKLAEAVATKPTDPLAVGYSEMAAAALASARGDLKTAVARSEDCLARIGTAEPIAASICQQLRGDAEASRGDAAAARGAYQAGLALARIANNAQRTSELSLALEELELDEKQEDADLDAVTKLKQDARRRQAVSAEATAAVLVARNLLIKADQQGALDVFDNIDADVLQSLRTKTLAKVTIGQVYGYRGEADGNGTDGLAQIDAATADAKKRGAAGLVLEGRLARVMVKLITGAEDAEAERASLITDANAKGYKRIATLAAVDVSVKPATPPSLDAGGDPMPPETLAVPEKTE